MWTRVFALQLLSLGDRLRQVVTTRNADQANPATVCNVRRFGCVCALPRASCLANSECELGEGQVEADASRVTPSWRSLACHSLHEACDGFLKELSGLGSLGAVAHHSGVIGVEVCDRVADYMVAFAG